MAPPVTYVLLQSGPVAERTLLPELKLLSAVLVFTLPPASTRPATRGTVADVVPVTLTAPPVVVP